MQRRVILLRPLGPQASPILSHTLFGATCWALAALGEDVGAMLSGFGNGARFAMSGAYPYLRDRAGKLYLLLPRPPFRIPSSIVEAYPQRPIAERVDIAKKVQKAAYLSPGVAQRLRDGTWKPAELFRQVMQKGIEIHYKTLFLASEAQQIARQNKTCRPWHRVIVQRNSVDRLAGATAGGLLFHQEETFYDRGWAGLWFAVWSDDDLWSKLCAAFRFVEDTGLGGKRSVGKGHFRFEVDPPQLWDASFPPLRGSKRFLNLSHYIPCTPDETVPIVYTLGVIRQKAENRYPQGRQRVYVATLRTFQPGGLFEATGTRDDLYGRLLPLGSIGERTVYYDGLTIPLWGAWEV